ncbi:uncharacterized protein LOC121370246 [Gigantopelta aegis]|uniref:uncharacterized protein LOC121370246 n=1 Tax=Gigantopelta aegis TaxID=1735272 RepID=UPI001B88896A|nr:uncharacterized protein LOC121370246 [Gigantopelta aegis]
MLPEPINDGWEMVLNGIPEPVKKLVRVNIGTSKDLYVVFSARLDAKHLVFNSLVSGVWERKHGIYVNTDIFPFTVNSPFELRIAYQNSTFTFSVNGGFIYNYTITHPVVIVDRVLIWKKLFVEILKFIY